MRSLWQSPQRSFNALGLRPQPYHWWNSGESAARNPDALKCGSEGVGILDKQRLTHATNRFGRVWLDSTCPVSASWCMCGACVSSRVRCGWCLLCTAYRWPTRTLRFRHQSTSLVRCEAPPPGADSLTPSSPGPPRASLGLPGEIRQKKGRNICW